MGVNMTKVVTKEGRLQTHIQTLKGRVYVSTQHGIGDEKDPFTKSRIQAELQGLLDGTETPNQGDTSLCGPTAFFYCLLKVNPSAYEKYVWDLYYHGKAKINNWEIAPSIASMKPSDLFNNKDELKVKGVNWITLSSLRDASNAVLPYSAVSKQVAGITLPEELEQWFKNSNFKHIKSFTLPITLGNLLKLNHYVTQPNHFIISLIDPVMLKDQPIPFAIYPKHWVVWSSTLNTTNGQPITKHTKMNDNVRMSVCSWGDKNVALQDYLTLLLLQVSHFNAIVIKY